MAGHAPTSLILMSPTKPVDRCDLYDSPLNDPVEALMSDYGRDDPNAWNKRHSKFAGSWEGLREHRRSAEWIARGAQAAFLDIYPLAALRPDAHHAPSDPPSISIRLLIDFATTSGTC